ncbi:MAG TPA: ring-cleaving dioxygenase [Fimbriimonadaceae bacterium]|jgi:glyoxalase family protein
MADRISGIHHVTAICGFPQQNIDFYSGVLGLRLVKVTVNFDDPGSYHFYYGDESGKPGTLLTFFPSPGGYEGRMGSGQTSAIALAIPNGSLEFWRERLTEHEIEFTEENRFGESLLSFEDPDRINLELIESEYAPTGWSSQEIGKENAIIGIHGVSLLHENNEATLETLVGEMGCEEVSRDGNRTRFAGSGTEIGRYIDLIEDPEAGHGRVAVGSVHHVAFRTENDASQQKWFQKLSGDKYGVSPITERDYFRSIYYRERGGVLFEIATDGPGMAIDEPVEALGSGLKLPQRYEPYRSQIEKALLPIRRRWRR